MICNSNNRLLIYFFYDKDGIVDNYITYMISKIMPFCKDAVIVSNGKINDEGKNKLNVFTKNILERENKGFDVWAYKEALEYYGWDNIVKFDEVIFMNFTIMGPVDSFDDMFATMGSKDLDFWGITIGHEHPVDPFNLIEYNYIPIHIQSHFISVRNSMLRDKRFMEYWKHRPMITSYNEAVAYHEAIFTKKFEDMGFTWDIYADTRSIYDYTFYPLLFAPKKMIKELDCPIFKRKSFILDYMTYLDMINGEAVVELLNYLQHYTLYDINMIWDNILRTSNQYDIKNCLHLNYILPTEVITNTNNERNVKVALMMHIYFEDLIEECFHYASSMPKNADIYITTDSDKKIDLIRRVFSELPNKLHIEAIGNRGRDVASLTVALQKYVFKYDLICFTHDKKVGQLNYKIKGQSFSYQCFENILATPQFVLNIIDTFINNPRLGLLTPPPPQFADYFPTVSGYGWGNNFNNVQKFIKELNLTAIMNESKEPIAPYGSAFWFRMNALKPLFDRNLQYNDFPEEPLPHDGSISHAIERSHSLIVQSQGYYPAWVLSDTFARIQITNLHYMLTQMNRAVFSHTGPNLFSVTVDRVKNLHIINMSVYRYAIYKLKLYIKTNIKSKSPRLYSFLVYIKNKVRWN